MEGISKNSLFIENTNNKHNFKQKQLNYIFITISFAYFLVLNFAFDKLFMTSTEEMDRYREDSVKKKYTFLRPFQVLLKRVKTHSIAFSTFLFFLGFIVFLYFKYKLTDQRNKTLYGSNSDKVQQHIESIYKKLNYKTNLTNNVFNSWIIIFLISTVIVFTISNLFVYLIKYAFTITTITSSFLLVLNILIILIGVGFLYSFAKKSDTFNTVTRSTKLIIFMKLLESTILYIPCLLNDLIIKYTNTKENTNDYVFKILLIEILLLFLTFVVPIIDKYISTNLGNTLVDKPLYLDINSNYKVKDNYKIDNNNNIIIKTTDEILRDNSNEIYGISGELFHTKKYNKETNSYSDKYVSYKKYDHNFSVSFWVYFDPIETSTIYSNNYQTILNVSNNPHIFYNSKTHKMKFLISQKYGDQKNGEILISNIPQQKWNHFVINYTNGIMDVFMDGILIETKNKVMLNYSDNNGNPKNITVGQSPGLKGRITNISYFNNPLTKSEINTLYVFKKNQTPPTPGGFFLNTRLIYNNLISGKKSNSSGGFTLDDNNPAVYVYGKISGGVRYVTTPLVKYINDPELAFNDTKNFIINLPGNVNTFFKRNIDYIIFDFDDTLDASGIKIKQYSPEYLADLRSRRQDMTELDHSKYQLCGERALANIWLGDADQSPNIHDVEPKKRELYFEVGDSKMPAHLINYRTDDHSGDKCFTTFDMIHEKDYCEDNDGIYSDLEAKCFGLTKHKCGYEVYKKKKNDDGSVSNYYELDLSGVPVVKECTYDENGNIDNAPCGRMGEAGGTYIDKYDPRNDTGTDFTNRTPYCINLYKDGRG